jgi:hypothetical protein
MAAPNNEWAQILAPGQLSFGTTFAAEAASTTAPNEAKTEGNAAFDTKPLSRSNRYT